MTCILCELIEKGDPIYQDDFCFFIIGNRRRVPMGIVKVHGMPLDEKIKFCLKNEAYNLYGKNIKLIDPMNTVKDHYHIHVYKVNLT